MRRTSALTAAVVAIAAQAAASPTPVIGGRDVASGRWRDAAAVLYDGEQGCTGVLVAPTVVLTAAHCLDRSLDAVLLGTSSLARPSAGETIEVVRQVPYPADKYDLALLVLARPSAMPVRRLATGWAQDDVVDGAAVTFVGYGAIDRDAEDYVDELQEAESTITDAGCTRGAGCDPACRPDGEIGAGGAGIDTCPGDSGGPMYLGTDPRDALLVGITSRGYDDNAFPCSEGGIYTRPDKDEIVAWIERETGAYLDDGRGPIADEVVLAPGATHTIAIDANDARAAGHRWEMVAQPALGAATLADDGALTVTAPDEPGEAFVVVRAIDAADPARAARVRVALRAELDDGGCCQTGGPAPGGLVVALAAGGLVFRRRRRGAA